MKIAIPNAAPTRAVRHRGWISRCASGCGKLTHLHAAAPSKTSDARPVAVATRAGGYRDRTARRLP